MLLKNIKILYAVALLQGMVFYAPVATLYRKVAGITVWQISVIESISLALALLLEIPWGAVADRIGYRRTLLICNGLFFVSKIVFWRADGFGAFLAERILLSVVVSGISGVDTSLLYLSCGETDSRKVFGLYSAFGQVGLFAATVIFSLYIGENYRLAGFLTVISYGFAALLTFGIREVPQPKNEHERATLSILRQTFQNKTLLLLLLSAALLRETHQTLTVFLSQLQYQKSGMTAAAMGGAYLLVTLAGFSAAFSDPLAKKIGTARLAVLCFVFAATACAVLSSTANAFLSVGCLLLLRVAASVFSPLQTQLQNQQIISANRATALSVQSVFMSSIGCVTSLAFGRAAESGVSLAMTLAFLCCVCGLVLFYRANSVMASHKNCAQPDTRLS